MRELGAEAVSFDPIVASGPNAALPHHHPGSRIVEPGETFLVDAGCLVDGYCSDCTRTFATGHAPARARARLRGLPRRPAARRSRRSRRARSCREVDAVARAGSWPSAGYTVLHSLGHAVGLEIHEEPRLADTVDRRARGRQRRDGRARRVPARPRAVSGSRISSSSSDGGPEVLTPFPKELRDLVTERSCGPVARGRRDRAATTNPPPWPRRSPPRSSRTACTSSSTGRCGGSSSSST